MGIYSRVRAYSKRAWIVALFLALAFLFGGGEAKSPAAELLLQLFFAAGVVAWIWSPGKNASAVSPDSGVALLVTVLILAVPLVQLVPLPPALWHSLPGREPEAAALALAGAADDWRPLSAVPLRTLATLLSTIPPLGLFLAMTRMDLRERTLVPRAVLAMAFLTAVLGGLQLVARDGSLTLYSQIHAAWVTGFQSNRNHAAEVLLAGLLALAFVVKRATMARNPQAGAAGSTFRILATGLGLVLLTALVLTGSRAGISLGLVAGFAGVAMLLFPAREGEKFPVRYFAAAIGAVAILALVGVLVLRGDDTNVARVAARFADLQTERSLIWADAVYALGQYWPVGIGAGGFVPAMFPAERLEYVNASYPNQAHNDFLEIGIEAGILGYVVLACVLAAMTYLALRSWFGERRPESRLQLLFAGSVLILLTLHSVVDYPLRSMSLACLAGAAGGMLTRAGRRESQADRRVAPDRIKGLG